MSECPFELVMQFQPDFRNGREELNDAIGKPFLTKKVAEISSKELSYGIGKQGDGLSKVCCSKHIFCSEEQSFYLLV